MSPSTAIELGSVPAACMLLFTFIGLGRQVPPAIAGALQHFAAGVLLCTIGTELLPEMQSASGWRENLAVSIGFFLGVALLIALGIVMPETEGNDDEDELNATEELGAKSKGRQSILGRNCSLKAAAFTSTEATFIEDVLEEDGIDSSAVAEDSPLVHSGRTASPKKAFPTTLVLAVVIDSVLDGFLIGIAVAAGPSAGPMMSASLAVEMSFLGLTLATALHGHPRRLSLSAAFSGPMSIILGAAAGGFLASTLGSNPVLMAGMLSFGTSALLFMVAEELLLEAHEDGRDHCWWVDLQLYVGFFVSVMAGKLAK